MNKSEQARIAELLKNSLPPVTGNNAELGRDLWPAMLQRLQQPAAPLPWFQQAWFDWALLAAVAVWLAFFPAAIPVLLFHL
jgi:hypothetical protein